MSVVADRLSPADSVNLAVERADSPMHVAVIARFDGAGPTIGEVRSTITARLSRLPRLRQRVQRPRWGLGRLAWAQDSSFQIQRHVHTVAGPPLADRAALLQLADTLLQAPMDREHPLWQLWLVTGLADTGTAVIVAVHHAMADGAAAIALLGSLLGGYSAAPTDRAPLDRAPLDGAPLDGAPLDGAPPDRAPPDPGRPADRGRPPGDYGRRVGLRRAGWTGASWRLLWGAPRTTITAPVGPARRSVVLPLDLATVQAVARRHGTTVNDLVLALVAGGLRALLAHRGEQLPTNGLPIAIPVSHRLGAADQGGNRSGVIVVRLPLQPAEPVARLAAVHRATNRAKRDQRPTTSEHALTWLARTGLLRWFSRHQRMTSLVVSDLIGPADPVWFFGRRVRELIPLSPLAGNLALAFLAFSYAGQLTVTIRADAEQFPDLAVVVAAMERDWADLGSSQ
jgi:WS/DGAT/MGAT family acyltransferase